MQILYHIIQQFNLLLFNLFLNQDLLNLVILLYLYIYINIYNYIPVIGYRICYYCLLFLFICYFTSCTKTNNLYLIDIYNTLGYIFY